MKKKFTKKSILLWQFSGFATAVSLGTFLHFLYDLTGITFTALFSAVNESTWEHMKILFFPMFLFCLAESLFIGKSIPNFWCTALLGTILGVMLIPTLFYTLTGIFGSLAD